MADGRHLLWRLLHSITSSVINTSINEVIDGVLNNENSKSCAPSGCTGIDDKLTSKLAHLNISDNRDFLLHQIS